MRFLYAALFAILITTSSAFAGIEEGRKAYMAEDWFTAIKELRPLAEQGNGEALVMLGNMYNDGKGVSQNHEMAFSQYKQALASGNDNAMLAIATMYVQGLGTEKDFPAGFEWFTKSAEAGNPAGQFMLASLYLDGHPELPDLKPDPVKAYGWYRIAARQDRLPDVATAGKELARRLTVKLTPDQILEGEKFADNYYAAQQDNAE